MTTEHNIIEHMNNWHEPYPDDGRVVTPERYALIVHQADHDEPNYTNHTHN